MKLLGWLLGLGVVAGLGFWLWLASRRYAERKRASEERFATFLAQTMRPATAAPRLEAAPAADLLLQRLLLEAAAKAGEAGEPAISIQLYARLIVRYPNGELVAQALAAVETQKSKLSRS